MYKKIINILFLITFFSFILLTSRHYFSEQNVIFTNKLRSSYLTISDNDKIDLPTLENDTKNIIVYINDLEDFKKKRKKRFWEKLISDKNE